MGIPFILIFIVLIVCFLAKEKTRQKKIEQQFDERQLRIRGQSAWYGIYTMLVCAAAAVLAESVTGRQLLSAGQGLFFGAMLSLSVSVGFSILHDSYYPMDREERQNRIFLVLIAAVDVLCMVLLALMIRDGAFRGMESIQNDSRVLPAMCIPPLTVILICSLLRAAQDGKEDDE